MHNNTDGPGKSTQAKSWRDVLLIHPAAEIFPRPSAEELRVLAEDIKRNGQQRPIAVIEKAKPRADGTYHVKDPPQLIAVDGISRLDAREAVNLEVIDAEGRLVADVKRVGGAGAGIAGSARIAGAGARSQQSERPCRASTHVDDEQTAQGA
jgi:hypothetical protein